MNKTNWAFAKLQIGTNFTRTTSHHQKKRSLIFENGGIIKLVIGPIISVPLEDPNNWRSLICLYNFHIGEYIIPTKPTYPWDKWSDNESKSFKKSKLYRKAVDAEEPDGSREFFYTALEYFINLHTNKRHGRECLLRLICENSQIKYHIGLFSEILNVILTPGKENLNKSYRQAVEFGQLGVDCVKYYAKCPPGDNFLDHLIHDYV
ncbi:uncharacterized protein LOC119640018 [Glossina fuscipes]|uniref:Uncharacterized protein LOC119640018 n=1 Tax=Glossina fuscipes TaxID=7396 RepID=A0A9C5ZC31_9MUSC|nr:uncharacterized protein LOC119640018 [Glossina fuscipes]